MSNMQLAQPEDGINLVAKARVPLQTHCQDTVVRADQDENPATLAQKQLECSVEPGAGLVKQQLTPYNEATVGTQTADHVQPNDLHRPLSSTTVLTAALAAGTAPSVTQQDVAISSAEVQQRDVCQVKQPIPRHDCQQWVTAAKEGDLHTLQRLYQQHPDIINYQPAAGLQCSALHWVAAHGHSEVMQHLLLWGADPCLLTATGSSCLHSAAAANRQECVELLLKVPKVLDGLTTVDEDGFTAAGAAGKHGHKVVQGMLLDAAARAAGGSSSATGCSSSTQLQLPATSGPPSCLLQVRKQQTAPSGLRAGFLNAIKGSKQPGNQGPEGLAAGAAAAVAGDVEAINIQHDSTHEAHRRPNFQSRTNTESFDDGNASASSTGRSWLDAARSGNLPAMQSQLAAQPKLLQYCGTGTTYAFTGNTALHWSAAKGHVEVVQWLLQQEADVYQVNEAGETALHTAVGHGQPGCAQVLVLAGGADVHMQDGLGLSAMQVSGWPWRL